MRIILALSFVMLVGASAAADYTYSNGYWWNGNQAYVQSYGYSQGYWHCGVYYPGSRYAYYTYSHTYTEPKKEIKYDEPSAIEQLLKAKAKELADRDKVATFANAAKVLGYDLTPQASVPLYAQGGYPYGGYGGYGRYYRDYYPPSGQTQYGVAPLSYGQLDLNQLNLNTAQLTQSMIDASKGALAQHQTLVDNQTAGAAKVAEIKAKGDVAMALMQQVFQTPALRQQGFEFKIGGDGSFTPRVGAMAAPQREALQKSGLEVLQNRCARCHSGATKNGSFDIADWPKFDEEKVDAIIVNRLMTRDQAKLMPRNDSGGPGTPLSVSEVLALKTINAK